MMSNGPDNVHLIFLLEGFEDAIVFVNHLMDSALVRYGFHAEDGYVISNIFHDRRQKMVVTAAHGNHVKLLVRLQELDSVTFIGPLVHEAQIVLQLLLIFVRHQIHEALDCMSLDEPTHFEDVPDFFFGKLSDLKAAPINQRQVTLGGQLKKCLSNGASGHAQHFRKLAC